MPAVCKTENENTSTETKIQTDIRYRCKHAHTTQRLEYDEWCLGLRRLHFIREEDRLCAKFSVLFILSGLWRASADNGRVSRGGITHPGLGQTLSYSLYCIVCRPHGSLKVSRSALRWWITYKDWRSRRVSCFLQRPQFITGLCVESVVIMSASSCVTNTNTMNLWRQ